MQAKAAHFTPCSKRRWVVSSPKWMGPERPIRSLSRRRTKVTVEAGAVRQCITKGAFAELRAAFVRLGSPLTGEFLDLEREIDSFASQVGTHALSAVPIPIRKGRPAGLGDQLAKIERNAKALREKAVERRRNAAKSI